MAEENFPEFVYRIISADDWAEAREAGIVAYRDIDRCDGFLHLSSREQALETARRYFSGRENMLALEIPLAPIADDVKYAPAAGRGGEMFPHLYGALSAAHVRRAIVLAKNSDGSFRFCDGAS